MKYTILSPLWTAESWKKLYGNAVNRIIAEGLLACKGYYNDDMQINALDYIVRRGRETNIPEEHPYPLFFIGDAVMEVERPEVKGIITDMFWHLKRDGYLYFIAINGKKKKRAYSAAELIADANNV